MPLILERYIRLCGTCHLEKSLCLLRLPNQRYPNVRIITQKESSSVVADPDTDFAAVRPFINLFPGDRTANFLEETFQLLLPSKTGQEMPSMACGRSYNSLYYCLPQTVSCTHILLAQWLSD